jgi:phosphoglycerol transferase MdoB-like AlkP superfamily enzyme
MPPTERRLLSRHLFGDPARSTITETSRRSVAARWLTWERTTAIQLVAWHLSLLLPTLGFKYLYARRMAFTSGLETILETMGSGVDRYLNLTLLMAVDVAEVSVLVGGLFLTGRLLRIPMKALIFSSVFLSLLIMGANQYSLLLVASLMTIDTVAISLNWAGEHPYVVWQSVGLPEVGFLVLTFVWSSLFAAVRFPKLCAVGFVRKFADRWTPLFLTALLIISALGFVTLARTDANVPAVLRGYWSSTLVSFLKLDAPAFTVSELPSLATLHAEYKNLAYPEGMRPTPDLSVAVPSAKLRKRHIVVVVLETAPRRYYRLIDNPELPVFHRMSREAIVTDHHYAMSPYTWWNNASILSGTYFVHKGRSIFDYGHFRPDAISSILSEQDYITTFVESSKHGWGGATGFWQNFGFANLLDSEDDAVPFDRSSYAVTIDKERQSFLRAFEAITHAESLGKKAFVMVGTTIGHYPWPNKPGAEGQNNEKKLFGIAALFDELLGVFLRSLDERGLGEQVLIVVTGDHGFRMRTEFESVGLKPGYGDAAFNVPFLLYGPGLFEKQIRLPYATSHVDIAPTLLALTGIRQDKWLHHGTNMLDSRLRDRVTFMMNTNLSPVSGFHWQGCHYTVNDLTRRVQIRTSAVEDTELLEDPRCNPGSSKLSDDAVRSILQGASRQFQMALTYFQRRKDFAAKPLSSIARQ